MIEILALAAALAAADGMPQPAAPPVAATGHDATIHHGFDDVPAWVQVFDDPGRDAWQKPDTVIRELGVAPGMTVADLGAGTGYFSVRLAKAVGPHGRVLAIDIEPKLVDHIKARAAQEALPQIAAVLATPDDPKIPPHGVSLVLIVDTWHHIDDRLHYLTKLAAGLAPGGRVAVVDFKKGDFPVGPPDAHKLTPEAVVAEFVEAGWTAAGRWDDLPYQYVLSFAPPADQRGLAR
jgi:ubiquinone/menaquinone biosynthesis C-methylase UbiE